MLKNYVYLNICLSRILYHLESLSKFVNRDFLPFWSRGQGPVEFVENHLDHHIRKSCTEPPYKRLAV